MPKKIAVLLDGGHLRAAARRAGLVFDPDFIEKLAHTCVSENEDLLRVLYYDCAPYRGTAKLPVSGSVLTFDGSDAWLRNLAQRDLIAVRLGVLKFRGFILKRSNIPYVRGPAKDEDFEPQFEQKGVDMRIGLDMAGFAANRAVDLLVLATNDTDCIPAMKQVRRAGLQVALAALPGARPAPELLAHADFTRKLSWPNA